MSTTTEPTPQARLHTIGAVCERLRSEFPDPEGALVRMAEDVDPAVRQAAQDALNKIRKGETP